MRVLFDHQAFSMQSHGGVSRCFAELYRYLPESVEAYISVKETDNVYLRDMAVGVPVGYNYEHFIFPFNFPLKSRLFGIYNDMIFFIQRSLMIISYHILAISLLFSPFMT